MNKLYRNKYIYTSEIKIKTLYKDQSIIQLTNIE